MSDYAPPDDAHETRPIETPAGPNSGPQLAPGARVGDFTIVRMLGKGGMGEVYLAEQLSLKRKVALKTLRRELIDDPNYLRRFEAEAKAVAPISHPNIVSVIAIGCEDGIHFIAFEYVQGMNLKEYIVRKERLTIPEFLTVARNVANALVRAAEEGIVHRDIKPENVLLTNKGEVKVADFGLARQLSGDRVELTQSGVTMGTPLYMSPEQVEGHAVDHRSDLYSLGVMSYHMLAGEPPYRGETALAVALQHLKATPIPLASLRPDCPQGLIATVEKLMAKDPNRRFQSAIEVAGEFARFRTKAQLDSDQTLSLDEAGLAANVDPAIGKLAGASNFAATASRIVGLLAEPRRRWLWFAVSVALSFAAGGAWALLQREPELISAVATKPSARELAARIPKQETAGLQLLLAREALPADDVEAGLWAVLDGFTGEANETVGAAIDLLHRYLPMRRYDDALSVSNFMAERENQTQKIVGDLFRGIVLSRQGQAAESNLAFVELFDRAKTQGKGKEIRLPRDRLDWVARQYLLALRANYERLGKPVNETMIDNFWTTFLPPLPQARGGRRL